MGGGGREEAEEEKRERVRVIKHKTVLASPVPAERCANCCLMSLICLMSLKGPNIDGKTVL